MATFQSCRIQNPSPSPRDYIPHGIPVTPPPLCEPSSYPPPPHFASISDCVVLEYEQASKQGRDAFVLVFFPTLQEEVIAEGLDSLDYAGRDLFIRHGVGGRFIRFVFRAMASFWLGIFLYEDLWLVSVKS
jgi:hypothetical protein